MLQVLAEHVAMTTSEEPEAAQDRLVSAGDRIADAKRAAADVAEQQHITDDERRTAAEDAVGRGTGDGAEITPG